MRVSCEPGMLFRESHARHIVLSNPNQLLQTGAGDVRICLPGSECGHVCYWPRRGPHERPRRFTGTYGAT